MALSARDLYFAVRVEDRATRPLRRISESFRTLGRAGTIGRQRGVSQARVLAQRAEQTRRLTELELASVKSGTRRLGLERQQAAAAFNLTNQKLREAGVEKQITANMALQNEASAKLSRLQRTLARAGGHARGFTRAETQQLAVGAQQRVAALNQQLDILAQRAGLSGEELRILQLRMRQLSASESELIAKEGLLTQRLETRTAATEIANQRLADANLAMRSLPYERVERVGHLLSRLGRSMIFLGGAAAFAFGTMAKSAADFSTQVTIAATQSTRAGQNTVQQVRNNAKYLQRELINIMAAGKAVAPPEDLARSAYEVFSGVTIPGNQQTQLRKGIQLVKDFNNVTKANFGLVNLEEVTKAGIIIMNRFGLTTRQMPRALNTMQAAVRYGRLTMSEFIQSLNQAAPAAQSAGYNFKQMSSTIAFLSRQFSSVRMASTGYARLLEILARPEITQGLRQKGVEITRGGRLLALPEIIRRIREGFPTIRQGSLYVQNFFKQIGNQQGTIQARRAFQSLVQQYGSFRNITRSVDRDQNELRKSIVAAAESPGVKWTEFINRLKAMAYTLGNEAIPAFEMLGGWIRRGVDWFNELDPAQKKAIGYFGAMAAIGTILGGVLIAIAGGVTTLYGALRLLLVGRAAATAVEGLGAAAGFAQVRLLLVFGVLGPLLFMLIKYPGAFHKITDAVGGTEQALRILGAALTVMAIRQLGVGMLALAANAGVATASIARLRLMLLSIPTFLLITIAAEILFNKEAVQGKVDRFMNWTEGRSAAFRSRFSSFMDKIGARPPEVVGRWRKSVDDFFHHIARSAGVAGLPAPADIARLPTPELDDKQILRASQRVVQETERIKRAAKSLGVVATPAFREVFKAYTDALRASRLHPASFTAQMNLQRAAEQLKQFTDEQRKAAMAAAKATVTREQAQKRFSDKFIIAERKRVQELYKIAKQDKSFAAWKAYYRALNKLQNDATEAQMQTLDQLFNTANGKVKKSAKDLQDHVKSATQGLQSIFDNFLEQNKSAFGQLFSGPWITGPLVQNRLQWSQALRTGDLFKDLRLQVGAFRKWRRDLDNLQARGVPPELLAQIQQLGPEAAKEQLELLNRMAPGQLRQYVGLWQKSQKDIQAATKIDTERQIRIYKQFGQKVALAIIEGIKSQNPHLTSILKDMLRRLLPEVTAPATPTTGGAGKTTQRRGGGDGGGASTTTHHHTHYHVTTTAKDDDVKKQLKDAAWHHSSRYDPKSRSGR